MASISAGSLIARSPSTTSTVGDEARTLGFGQRAHDGRHLLERRVGQVRGLEADLLAAEAARAVRAATYRKRLRRWDGAGSRAPGVAACSK